MIGSAPGLCHNDEASVAVNVVDGNDVHDDETDYDCDFVIMSPTLAVVMEVMMMMIMMMMVVPTIMTAVSRKQEYGERDDEFWGDNGRDGHDGDDSG